ncbi:epoxide hydrolase family protein [Novosphingobium sp.]|uniref:epoxide hydrolase family protein n=1 Tax=Novosphingobium sp. TaxID=1874826 RepID=UPI0038B9497E
MTETVEPFTWHVAQDAIDDLHRRIDATRWPERETVDDWSQGVPLDALRDFVDHWRNHYDWRSTEAWINAQGLSTTTIDGVDIRFLHVRSAHENARPLLLTHGWPGSILEFRAAIPRLVDPEAHGGTAADAFHVVIPSLPGYGLSGKPTRHGWKVEKIAQAWGVLMARLGYAKWYAQGGDWGAAVTTQIGRQNVAGCAGIHLNMPIARPLPEDLAAPGPDELKTLAALQHYQEWDAGYSKQQQTRPQTIGYSLVDSPVGLAGWIYEKMWAWTDNQGRAEDALSRDSMCDNLMLYWLTAAGASSARLYWESFASFAPAEITMPVGASVFPKEILPAPRKWAERHYTKLVHWGVLDKGGHFAAWEQPEVFVNELRKTFAAMD